MKLKRNSVIYHKGFRQYCIIGGFRRNKFWGWWGFTIEAAVKRQLQFYWYEPDLYADWIDINNKNLKLICYDWPKDI